MTVNMNKHVPPKRPQTEPPTEVHDTNNPQAEEHKKMERMADRAAHKAAQDEQKHDEDHNIFTI
ncbi:MAG: hypothetical protein ACLGSD_08655 [Acidobacteriota bacterium]